MPRGGARAGAGRKALRTPYRLSVRLSPGAYRALWSMLRQARGVRPRATLSDVVNELLEARDDSAPVMASSPRRRPFS